MVGGRNRLARSPVDSVGTVGCLRAGSDTLLGSEGLAISSAEAVGMREAS